VSDYSRFYSEHLQGIKWRSRGEGSAKCPFHDDRKASLSVNRESGLWFCHACNRGGTARDFAERLEIEAPLSNLKSAEHVFDYRDAKGALLYQVVRFADKEFRQRRPDGKGGWIWNLQGVPRVLYRLPELLKAKDNVFIVEGEKDVEALRANSFVATTNPGGAGKWCDEYGEHLRDRVCILIADNDDPGHKHVEDVCQKLAPYSRHVINLGALPGSPEHGDVSDWFAQGHTAADLLALASRTEGSESAPGHSPAAQSKWPEAPADDAFYGLADDFVRMVKPNTEADPAAVLVHFLVMFGSLVGGGPYRLAGGQRHHLNEYALIIGETKRGRKGTALAEAARPFEIAASEWFGARVMGGLSSGEGLIWQVRDPIMKRQPVKERGRHTGEYVEYEDDPGIGDKRLMVVETEFSQALKVMAREGNTLSEVLRKAWDGGNLAILSRNSPTRATAPHVSILGHITPDELAVMLDSTSAANGFGNRFLFVCSRRTNFLPWGGSTIDARMPDFARMVAARADEARKTAEFKFDPSAVALWEREYPRLSEGGVGLVGALTGRAEAHVVRLACIYAAIAGGESVREPHLRAALALWDYCERSAQCLFGARYGDPMMDAIVDALRQRPEGMTMREIDELFSGHKKASELQARRAQLLRLGRIMVTHESTGGRPAERWTLVRW